MAIPSTCQNCGRDSHFLGMFCWWGVALSAPLLAAYVAFIVWVIGWVLL